MQKEKLKPKHQNQTVFERFDARFSTNVRWFVPLFVKVQLARKVIFRFWIRQEENCSSPQDAPEPF